MNGFLVNVFSGLLATSKEIIFTFFEREVLKRTTLLFFILASLVSWSQKSNSFIDQRITYTSNEGYNIIDSTTAVYDELGWLWIAGNKAEQDEYLFEGKDIIIQRFDGVSFYNISLPTLI